MTDDEFAERYAGNCDAELIDRMTDNMRLRGLSTNTVKRRRWTLRLFVVESGVSFAEATADDVESFMASRESPASRRAVLSDLRAFYAWANKKGVLSVNPTAPVDVPKVPKRVPTPLTRDELRRAWDAASGAGGFEIRLILMLGARAGLRVSEMAVLDQSDCDHDRRVLVVRQGKGGKDRVVPMAPQLSAMVAMCGSGPILNQSSGEAVSAKIRAHFKQLGIRKRAHDLRATFATEAAERSGGNLVLVQQLLGHESPHTTMRYMGWNPAGHDVVDRLFDDDDEMTGDDQLAVTA